MIEGSRHERAAIVSTAYIIGFVTAFIGFGVTSAGIINSVSNDQLTQTASVTMALQSEEVHTNHTKGAPAFFTVNDKGLFLEHGGEQRLLSLRSEEGSAEAGTHVALAYVEMSPDNNQVYFCEQYEVEDTTCAPFVYTVSSDMVEHVTVGGARQTFSADAHAIRWSEGALLSVNGLVVDKTVY